MGNLQSTAKQLRDKAAWRLDWPVSLGVEG
jgi:hypothetical protein